MAVRLAGSVTVDSLEQSKNASFSMVVTPSGSTMLFSVVQLRNAPSPMLVNSEFFAIVTLPSFSHCSKAWA